MGDHLTCGDDCEYSQRRSSRYRSMLGRSLPGSVDDLYHACTVGLLVPPLFSELSPCCSHPVPQCGIRHQLGQCTSPAVDITNVDQDPAADSFDVHIERRRRAGHHDRLAKSKCVVQLGQPVHREGVLQGNCDYGSTLEIRQKFDIWSLRSLVDSQGDPLSLSCLAQDRVIPACLSDGDNEVSILVCRVAREKQVRTPGQERCVAGRTPWNAQHLLVDVAAVTKDLPVPTNCPVGQ